MFSVPVSVWIVTSCLLDVPLDHVHAAQGLHHKSVDCLDASLQSPRSSTGIWNAFAVTSGSLLCRRRHYVRGALRLRVKDGVRPDLQKGRQAADCQQHVRVQSLQPLSSPPPPSDAAASQRRASEQILRVARGRGRVQTRWLTSAAGASDSDSDSEPDPLHLLAAVERDDTPPSHPLPVVGVIASKTATDFASQLGGSRGSCVVVAVGFGLEQAGLRSK